jgi:hypothetical protein
MVCSKAAATFLKTLIRRRPITDRPKHSYILFFQIIYIYILFFQIIYKYILFERIIYIYIFKPLIEKLFFKQKKIINFK